MASRDYVSALTPDSKLEKIGPLSIVAGKRSFRLWTGIDTSLSSCPMHHNGYFIEGFC